MLLCLGLMVTSCTSLASRGEKVSLTSASESHAALAFSSDESFADGLEAADKLIVSKAERQALDYGESGEKIGWVGQTKKAKGTIVAFQPFRVGRASCRRFEHKMTMVGEIKSVNGTACKKNDGSWRLVK